MLPNVATQIVASTRNSALTFGVLGLCLGGCLGMAGAWRGGRAAAVTGDCLARCWAWHSVRASPSRCCRRC